MLNALKQEATYTYTENGARTYSTTMDHCLDLFATAGGMRTAGQEEILRRFIRAYAENPDYAMKILFYARDIREGLGERSFFRTVLQFLAENHAASVKKNIPHIAEYGRFDDLLTLLGTPCEKDAIDYMKGQLEKDAKALVEGNGPISLLAKWLPSVNTSNQEKVCQAKALAKAFGMSEKEYRKTLAALRKRIDILENHLRETDYTFDYSKQPSKAMLKYRAAFIRNDKERYTAFMQKVARHEAGVNTGTLMPYELIRPFYVKRVSDEEAAALDTTWNALEDFAGDSNVLTVIDGSGSMYIQTDPMPATVAQSLGLYFAERNKGAFANHFITFSERPQLIEVRGKTLLEKLQYISSFNEIANTNIQAVFDLILNAAVKRHVRQEDMPKRIIIISDMEFDYCADEADITNFELAKKKFRDAGYDLPELVFWNVASRKLQLPVRKNERGVLLVSGCTAKLFEQVIAGTANPYAYMVEVIGSKRYEAIVA